MVELQYKPKSSRSRNKQSSLLFKVVISRTVRKKWSYFPSFNPWPSYSTTRTPTWILPRPLHVHSGQSWEHWLSCNPEGSDINICIPVKHKEFLTHYLPSAHNQKSQQSMHNTASSKASFKFLEFLSNTIPPSTVLLWKMEGAYFFSHWLSLKQDIL